MSVGFRIMCSGYAYGTRGSWGRKIEEGNVSWLKQNQCPFQEKEYEVGPEFSHVFLHILSGVCGKQICFLLYPALVHVIFPRIYSP